jgi:lysyl-tRNA synthetase class 2
MASRKPGSSGGRTLPPGLEDLRSRIHLLEARAEALWLIRRFFRRRRFLEVDPPLLVAAGGMEPHLDALEVYGRETGMRCRLPTSPEFYLKKLLASGVERCFALAPAFRDEPPSTSHSPEFLMLEWYRTGDPLSRLIRDCRGLLRLLANRFLPHGILESEGIRCDFNAEVRVLTLSEVFERWVGTDWRTLSGGESWRKAARNHGAETSEDWSENDCFSYLILTRVEPELAKLGRPSALVGFPPFQGALAREDPSSPGTIERFELYAGGVELANAYAELTDCAEQERRFRRYQEERKSLGKPPHPRDSEFFEAVRALPPCSGIAFGVDRLLSILLGQPLAAVRHGTRTTEWGDRVVKKENGRSFSITR